MKRFLSLCLVLTVLFSTTAIAFANEPNQTLTFAQDSRESFQSLCWVGDTLYMLGNETIYQWRVGDEAPQVYWQQEGIQNYRYQTTAPTDEAERTLWQQAVSYLVTDGASLYAWQPFSGQLFTVQKQALTLAATVPHSTLTYETDGQTTYRELRQVGMQGKSLYLLLGTDEPADWEKTLLFCFDTQTAQGSVLSTQRIANFTIAHEGTLLVSFYDREQEQATFHQLDATTGELQDAFLTLAGNQAGSMSFWQERLLLGTSGQLMGYDTAGTAQVMAYAPISANGGSKTACNASGLCAIATTNYVFLRDLTQKVPMTVLHIMGDLNPSLLIQFSLTNPDIAVITVPQTAVNSLQQSVLSANGDVDLYVVDTSDIYAQLKAKGYAAPLNASTKLLDKASAFYPAIQDTLMAKDQLMAFPINMSTESWTLNQTLWERFALGDVPKTYAELLALMQRWQATYAQEHPDYTLVDLFGGVSGCVKLLVKEYLLQSDTQYPDFTQEDFRNAMLAVIAHQDELNASAENYGMPLIYSYYQGFGIGYNDNEQTRMMLMPATSDSETQKLSGTLTLLTMSSASTQQDAALRFISYCADHVETQVQYMMNPSLDTPLRHDNHEERLATLQAEKAALEARLATTDDIAMADLKDAISQKEAQLASVKDDWLISSESIANYRCVAKHLVIPYDAPFFGSNAGFESLETVIDTACGQALTEPALDALLQDLNRVTRMVMLENQ